jgi:hypothetical protein
MARIGRFAPPLLLMALIYALSDQPDLHSGIGGGGDFALRKLAHIVEYGLLWFLWLRALNYDAPYAAAAIAIGFAITDEFHQSFVDGREGRPRDVVIDAIGITIAAIAYDRWGSRLPSARRRGGGRAGPKA